MVKYTHHVMGECTPHVMGEYNHHVMSENTHHVMGEYTHHVMGEYTHHLFPGIVYVECNCMMVFCEFIKMTLLIPMNLK